MLGGFYEVLLIVIIFLLLWLLYTIINVPINIAKRKGVSDGDLTAIAVLSWLGIFFGITWIIALIYACAAENKNSTVAKYLSKKKKESDMDKIEKAYKLMKKGIISKREYEKIKKESI